MIASISSGCSLISASRCFSASSVRSSASRSVAIWIAALRAQRRRRRNALIGLDRQLRLFQQLIEIGERQQRQRMVGLEIERKLQIDQRQILAAAAAERGAEPVQRFGGAGLREFDQRRQFLAVGNLPSSPRSSADGPAAPCRSPERPSEHVLAARCATASGHRPRPRAARSDRACRRARSACRFLLVAGEIVDQAGVQILEDGVPIGTGQPVDASPPRPWHRRRRTCAQADSSVAVRSVIGPRIDCARLLARGAILLLLERTDAEHQPATRSVLSACEMRSASLTDSSISPSAEQRQESAVEQIGVIRIVLERIEVIGGRGAGVALCAGMAGGEITARGRHLGERSCGDGACAAKADGEHQESGKRDARSACRGSSEEVTGMLHEAELIAGIARKPAPKVWSREWPFCPAPARTRHACRRPWRG